MIKEAYYKEGDVEVKAQQKLNGGLDIDIRAPHFTSVGTSIDASLQPLEHMATHTLRCLGVALIAISNDIAAQLPGGSPPYPLPTGHDPQAEGAWGSSATDGGE